MVTKQKDEMIVDYGCGNVVCCSVGLAMGYGRHVVFGQTTIAVMMMLLDRMILVHVRANVDGFANHCRVLMHSDSLMGDHSDPIAFVCYCYCCYAMVKTMSRVGGYSLILLVLV